MPKANAQRRRRLAVLALGFVGLLIVGAAVVLMLRWSNEGRLQEDVRQGVAAYEAQDFEQAVQLLEPRLDALHEDPDALYAYAKARLRVQTSDNSHVMPGLEAMRRVVELRPEHPEAPSELLQLLMLVGQDRQALRLAERLIGQDAGDVDALRASAVASDRLDRPDDAVAAARRLVSAAPDDADARFLLMGLLQKDGAEPEQMLAVAQGFREDRAEDPGRLAVLAHAQLVGGQRQAGRQTLERAAAAMTADHADLAGRLLRLLDHERLFRASLDMLSRVAGGDAAADTDDAVLRAMRHELVRRLYESDRPGEAVRQLGEARASTPAHLLGLRATLLYEAQDQARANATREALAGRDNDVARAWLSLVDVLRVQQPSAGRVAAAAQRVGDEEDGRPGEAYARVLQGQARSALGESEAAAAAYQQAIEARPVWATPYRLRGEALLSLGRAEEAVAVARQALRRQIDPRSAVLLVRGRVAQMGERVTPREGEDLLALIDRVQAATPGEEQTPLLQAQVLARLGRTDEAASRLRQFITRDAAPSREALLQAAGLSDRLGLGVSQLATQRLAEQYGMTPEVALDRAVRLHIAGQADAARALLEPRAQEDLAWRLAWARYLEQTGQTQAATGAWASLVEAAADNPAVLQLALGSGAAWMDRSLIDSVIQRLRQQTGESAVGWKISRARWLMSAEGSPDLDRAARLLGEVIEAAPQRASAYRLRGAIQQRMGRLAGAVEDLETARRLGDSDPGLLLELARLEQQRQGYEASARWLTAAIASPTAGPEQRRAAAVMLADQGRFEQAAEALSGLDEQQRAPEDTLLLARLQLRSGNVQAAEALVNRALTERPSAEAAALAARLYTATGRPERAQQVMDMLTEMPGVAAADREAARAEHAVTTGDLEAALVHLERGAQLEPDNPQRWRAWVMTALLGGQITDAADAARQGGEALGAAGGGGAAVREVQALLERVEANAAMFERLAQRPGLRALIASAVDQPDVGGAAVGPIQVLRRIDQTVQDGGSMGELADWLVQEARARPGELVLGQLTVVVLRNLGRFEEAAELASAAMYRFPSSEESARLAAEASMQAGWWEQARVGAQQWRQRSAAPQARMAVVESRAVQELGRWDEALRIIQPYAPVEGEPVGQASPDVIEQYARALAASGRVDRARQLLEPLLGGDASWRRLWLALAVEAVDHPGTAAGWMDRLAEATPAEDDGAWLAIGQGWLLMARRFEDPAYAQRALQLMQQRVAAGDAGLDTRLMLAMSAEVAGRLDLAERSYREVMAQRPSDLAARNNLAMLLVNRGGDGALAEALSLAEAVVAQSPEEPNYLDTLASVQSAMGDRDAAIRTLERAVRLDPSNRTWAEHLRRMRSD